MIDKYEYEFYKYLILKPDNNCYEKIWDQIKNDEKLLLKAIKSLLDSQNKYLQICYAILKHPEDVSDKIYDYLFNIIYSEYKVSEIKLSNNCFLTETLKNNNLNLTQREKRYIISFLYDNKYYIDFIDKYLLLSTSLLNLKDKKEVATILFSVRGSWKEFAEILQNNKEFENSLDDYNEYKPLTNKIVDKILKKNKKEVI